MNNKQKENLLIEYRQLVNRLARLEKTLEECKELEKEEVEILEKQENVMMEYSFILQERILIAMGRDNERYTTTNS